MKEVKDVKKLECEINEKLSCDAFGKEDYYDFFIGEKLDIEADNILTFDNPKKFNVNFVKKADCKIDEDKKMLICE